MDVSIIIVNYNSGKLLYNCVNSILDGLHDLEFEIIVVDNKSSDNSLDLCKSIRNDRLKIVESDCNLGFSKANNLGVKRSVGKILHFLNPDTEIDVDLIHDYKRVVEDVDNQRQMVYVNPMRDSDGKVYYGGNVLPDTLNYLKYLFQRDKTKLYYIGATIIMSKVVFDKIGGWNEKIFMYEEDADLFFRINKLKIPIIKLSNIIYHFGGGTSKKAFSNIEREILIQKSLRIYFRSNDLGILNYFLFEIMMVLSFIKKPRRAWWQVCAIVKSLK